MKEPIAILAIAGAALAWQPARAQTQPAPVPPAGGAPPLAQSPGEAAPQPTLGQPLGGQSRINVLVPEGTGTDPAVTAPASLPVPPGATRQLTVAALKDMELAGDDGHELGDIESIIEGGADRARFLVVSRGGVLGFGDKEVVLRLESVAVRNDKLILRGITDPQLATLPAFTREGSGYRELGGGETVTVPTQQ